MRTEQETLNSYSKKLKVEITPEELKPLEQTVIKRYQRQAEIPGFRKGKAPLGMIKKRFGDSIQQDIIEEALKQYYGKALDEAGIDPVAQGKITDFQFDDPAQGIRFEIEVEVEPEIELKKYKGLKVEKDVVEVSDEMVDDALQRLREQYATVKEVDEAQEGHFLHFEAQELDENGVPIVGHKYENLQAELGSGKFDPAIEKQLIGIKKDEKRVVQQEQLPPQDAPDQNPVTSKLEIHATKIEEKEFPELNEEFVKNLEDENLENMQQLRDRIRENMKLDFEHRSEQSLNQRLIDELLKENQFEVPPSMVETYLNQMVEDVKRQSGNQPVQEDAIRKQYRPSAIHNLRWYFLKNKLTEAENISVSDEEAIEFVEKSNLDEQNKKIAKENQDYLNHLKEDLLEQKVLDKLKEHAEITEVYPLKQEEEKPAEEPAETKPKDEAEKK